MDLKTLKLQIINRIIETKDPALLQTIAKVLDLQQEAGFPPDELPQRDNAAQDLQRSIDEVFGSEK